jgi:hypothetical protein
MNVHVVRTPHECVCGHAVASHKRGSRCDHCSSCYRYEDAGRAVGEVCEVSA